MKPKLIKTAFFSLLGIMIFVNSCDELGEIFSINKEKCTRCYACIPKCGYGAISVDSVPYMTADSFAYDISFVIDRKKCIGCGECEKVCPSDAIHSDEDGDGEVKTTNNATTTGNNVTTTTSGTTTTTTGTTTAVTYSITSSKCSGCGHCLRACSNGAISMSGGKAVINTSKCTGCGKCVSYCSRGAIHRN